MQLINIGFGNMVSSARVIASDHVVLSAVAPETVGGRAAVDEEDDDNV